MSVLDEAFTLSCNRNSQNNRCWYSTNLWPFHELPWHDFTVRAQYAV